MTTTLSGRVRRIAVAIRIGVCGWSLASAAFATSLQIRNVALVGSDTAPRAVRFEVSWKNGWSNARNHDAAWLFVKLRETGNVEEDAVHARLAASGHSASARKESPPANLAVSSDRAGAFLSGAAPFRGDAAFQVELALDVWERVVTLGHPRGRAFRGSHGDGALTPMGAATNEDWPRRNEGEGGYGYLGGGFYEQG